MNMKKMNIFKSIALLAVAVLSASGCTDLDEELYGRLTPDNYYQTEEQAVSSLAGCYEYMAYMSRAGGDSWRIGEYGTDELFCPGRANGGWYDEYVNQIMEHKCTPDNDRLNTCWNTYIFPGIGADNAILEAMQSSPVADQLKAPIAEARALRAYEYFYAMDYFGNVPLFTDARPEANNMPETAPRKDIYDFVVSEFLAAAEDLPSASTVGFAYYPRLTKEAVYTLLASVYLNAEVYSGSAHWQDVVTMCDKVINSGAFALVDNVGDCFLTTNEGTCKEVIIAFSVDPVKNVDANQFILYAQHAVDQQKYGLPFTPACGYCFSDEALSKYDEPGDARLSLLEYGPQYYLDGTPIENPDKKGEQLVLTALQSKVAAQNWEGYRVLKYSPIGANFSGANADNDYIAERYSNVLLMKAEALMRLGQNTDEALRLVNMVRTRSNLTLANLEKERAREFIWENQRRKDMIRFGSYFTEKTFYADGNTEQWRGIYPIPQQQINANPKLQQNPNY
jgi:hypothetical protein